ncbi:hypothetical protein BLNAU_18767 [Blattamonas nauphoetae]|uniref:t-SNARE coiled-coil homology domain-containing protein n=1 Tax=Blattamonas nauphoetae TaxID=2049346 RepID=A0ABQ9X5Y5_9EUKA|nr:hypothetical protein BLNAU_18767 [Blattamonas nauphoetae]
MATNASSANDGTRQKLVEGYHHGEEGIDSLERSLQLADEIDQNLDAGAQTLAQQGDTLNSVEKNLDDIDSNLDRSESTLKRISLNICLNKFFIILLISLFVLLIIGFLVLGIINKTRR